jgi:hypothetical protein
MNEPSKTLSEFTKSAAAWIGISGAVFAVLTFCMQLGMWFGPMKELPAQYNVILAKLSLIEGRQDKTDWAMDSMKSRADALASQMLLSTEDRQKIWDRLRAVDADASRLKTTSLSREDFVEWTSALGSRNKTLSVPTLSRHDP